jgi:hypothetical protein
MSDFIYDVRRYLDAEHRKTKSQTAAIFSVTAATIGKARYLFREDFTDNLQYLVADHDAIREALAGRLADVPCWIEIQKGPIATGFLFATWTDRSAGMDETRLMMQMWREGAHHPAPFVISANAELIKWQYPLNSLLYVESTDGRQIDQDMEERARRIGMTGLAALAWRFDPRCMHNAGKGQRELDMPTLSFGQ